jgi:hypothetical protein
MLRFRRVRTLRMFPSVLASIHNHFAAERHLQNRNTYRRTRASALAEWGRGRETNLHSSDSTPKSFFLYG